jgi:hypothetical protein
VTLTTDLTPYSKKLTLPANFDPPAGWSSTTSSRTRSAVTTSPTTRAASTPASISSVRRLAGRPANRCEAVVIGKAEALAAAAVLGLGADYRNLKSVSTDLDNIKIRRREH